MERKSSIIIRYLNRLKSRYLVEVMPKLRKVSSERIGEQKHLTIPLSPALIHGLRIKMELVTTKTAKFLNK